MKMNKLISNLFNLARRLTDVKTLASGDIKKIGRRAKNKYIGKKLIRKIWWSLNTISTGKELNDMWTLPIILVIVRAVVIVIGLGFYLRKDLK